MLEEFLAQRSGFGISQSYHVQAVARIRSVWDEAEVVVDHRFVDGGGRDVDHLERRASKQQRHAEHALLVMLDADDLHELLGGERDRRKNDDGPRREIGYPP